MEKKKIGLTSIAVIVAVGVLVLFQLLSMIDGYSNSRGGTFSVLPIGNFVVVATWGGLALLFVLKGKPFLGAIVIAFSFLIDRGASFIRALFNNTIDFSTTPGFSSLLILGALVFLVVAVVLERKQIGHIGKACIFNTPYLILILSYVGFRLLFGSVAVTVYAIVVLFIVAAFEEHKFIPLVIAAFTILQPFLLIENIIVASNNNVTAGASTWMANIIGTLILAFAIISFFIPNLTQKQDKPVEKLNDEPVQEA